MPGSPQPLVQSWVRPLLRFLRVEAASGIALLACAALAFAAAQSPLAGAWHAFFHAPAALRIGPLALDWTLEHWINDALMAVFFFVVGLEIKREFVSGELRDPRQAALPIAAALGGMLVPAALYLSLQWGRPGERGWGIPMATDIAFVVGALALLGPRVPHGLKILLLALAIVDDLGAIAVIAVGYSAGIEPAALAAGAAGLGLCALLARIGVRALGIYACVGAATWLAFVLSGVHPTVAGVLLGLLTPAHPTPPESVSPLDRLERALHPWVAFGIMPLFALANAGVRVEPAALADPVAGSVALGLVLGKPIGVLLFAALFVRLGLARLPVGVGWPVLAGAGCLAGIGFTMALFIAGLALEGELLDAAKIGILGGSALSAALGALLLHLFLPRAARAAGSE